MFVDDLKLRGPLVRIGVFRVEEDGVLGPLGERAPRALRGHRDHDPAVLASVVAGRVEATFRAREAAPSRSEVQLSRVVAEVHLAAGDHLVDRHVHLLALARAVAVAERHEGGEGGVKPCELVGLVVGLGHRRAAGLALREDVAPDSVQHQIVGLEVTVGARLAEGSDGGEDETGASAARSL